MLFAGEELDLLFLELRLRAGHWVLRPLQEFRDENDPEADRLAADVRL